MAKKIFSFIFLAHKSPEPGTYRVKQPPMNMFSECTNLSHKSPKTIPLDLKYSSAFKNNEFGGK